MVKETKVSPTHKLLHLSLRALNKQKVGDERNLAQDALAIANKTFTVCGQKRFYSLGLKNILSFLFLPIGSTHQKPGRLFCAIGRRGGLSIVGGHPIVYMMRGRS